MLLVWWLRLRRICILVLLLLWPLPYQRKVALTNCKLAEKCQLNNELSVKQSWESITFFHPGQLLAILFLMEVNNSGGRDVLVTSPSKKDSCYLIIINASGRWPLTVICFKWETKEGYLQTSILWFCDKSHIGKISLTLYNCKNETKENNKRHGTG